MWLKLTCMLIIFRDYSPSNLV
uniref:Uncharacterized protein n=1 Tax=Arundo donax TaxID=35708 RepID=A0A0A8ZER7_ARUDO